MPLIAGRGGGGAPTPASVSPPLPRHSQTRNPSPNCHQLLPLPSAPGRRRGGACCAATGSEAEATAVPEAVPRRVGGRRRGDAFRRHAPAQPQAHHHKGQDAGAGASGDEDNEEDEEEDGGGGVKEEHEKEEEGEIEAGEWMPSMEGFVRYLVDSKLVFGTIERVVAESTDVAYVYFRKSGLERSASISKDLEWFRKQGTAIPEPSTSGSTYAAYLIELAESNAPAFLSHYYNIYFAHITGGVAIGNKICEKILEGRELEFYKWDTDAELLLKDAREKLNELSKHWTRKDWNLCLKEAAKCFQYLGKMLRLIIL